MLHYFVAFIFLCVIGIVMPKKINQKCFECSQISRGVFRMNWPACYDFMNCRRKRSYYRNLEENRLKEHRWHRYQKFRDDRCFVCGSTKDLESHHVISQISLGVDEAKNVVTLCKSCHKTITSFEQKLGCNSKEKPRWVVSAERYSDKPME